MAPIRDEPGRAEDLDGVGEGGAPAGKREDRTTRRLT